MPPNTMPVPLPQRRHAATRLPAAMSHARPENAAPPVLRTTPASAQMLLPFGPRPTGRRDDPTGTPQPPLQPGSRSG